MPALGFAPDQRGRLRRLVANAVDGCVLVKAGPSTEGIYLIEARRPDGRTTHVRFLGVQSVVEPAGSTGDAPLRLRGVASAGSPLKRLLPRVLRPGMEASRVTIDAGESRIEIVCEDAEWWED